MTSSSTTRLFEGSNHAKAYAQFRPSPPASLAEAVVAFLDADDGGPRRGLALDVGCGSGQSTAFLSPHFRRVVGTDISENQIKEARGALDRGRFPNVEFSVAGATGWELPAGSASLVFTCQAVHWFDIPAFYAEADRALAPGGVLAVAGYDFTDAAPGVKGRDRLVELRKRIYEVTRPYWSDRRELVNSRYTTIPGLPYSDCLRDDSHYVEVSSTLSRFAGYLKTWSGFQKMAETVGQEEAEALVDGFIKEAKEILEVPQSTDAESVPLKLRTSYFLLLGRKPKHQ